MVDRHLFYVAVLLGLLSGGCAQQRSTSGEGQVSLSSDARSTATAVQGASPGGRPVQHTQEAYREQLLVSQLRQAQLDLQQVSTPEERTSVQERIAMIERQLDILGADRPNLDIDTLARQQHTANRYADADARDALYAAGRPVSHTQQPLFPRDVRDPQHVAAEQAVNMFLQTQLGRRPSAEAALKRRLSERELELQMATDPAAKDAIAREIATLRLQMAEMESR